MFVQISGHLFAPTAVEYSECGFFLKKFFKHKFSSNFPDSAACFSSEFLNLVLHDFP